MLGIMKKQNIIKCIILVLVLIFSLLVFWFDRISVVHRSEGYDMFLNIFNLVFVLLIVTICLVTAITLFAKDFKVERVYLVCALGLGIVMNLSILFRGAPDETTHSYKAYEISNVILGIDLSDNGNIMMRHDDAVTEYKKFSQGKEYIDSYYSNFFDMATNENLVDSEIKPVDTQWYLFFFSGLGITVGRLLGLGTTLTFMLGRLFNMLVFIGICYYAIKKIPFGKMAVYVWALLPITVQQVGSLSYDSMIYALSILIISLTMYFMYGEREENKKVRIVNIFLLIFACLLVGPCKNFALLPMAFVPVMLLVKKLNDNKDKIKGFFNEKKARKYVFIAVVTVICVGGIVAVAIIINKFLANAHGNGDYVEVVEEYAYPIGYFIKYPVDLLSRYVETVWYRGDGIFFEMFGSGLGWLEWNLPHVFVVPFFVLFVIGGLRREDEKQPVGVAAKLWMWIIFVGVGFLASLGMLLFWTSKSQGIINGVQGRYFLPAIVLPALSLRTKTTCVGRNVDKITAILIPVMYLFIVTALFKYFYSTL